MEPIPSAISTLLNALQSAAGGGEAAASSQPALPALLALMGKEVNLLFMGQAAGGGMNLMLPSGQVLTAQMQLPYPDGTQLLVKVLPGAGGDSSYRLQTLQALPPAPAAILAPLLQGEAAPLMASLGQPDPPPGLAALEELFQALGGGAAQEDPGPASSALQAALDSLPAPVLDALNTLLDVPAGADGSQPGLAAALDAWAEAQAPGQASSQASTQPGAQASATLGRPAGQALLEDLLQRLQPGQAARPEGAGTAVDSLARLIKDLVNTANAPRGDAQDRAAGAGRPGADTPAQALQTALGLRQGATPAAPETWETWIKASIKALNDPAVSPQGAAMHAAQAKEGTAFYEIPLPWAPQQPLQMWVESDRDPDGKEQPESGGQRVLLGLTLSNLGETRLGIAQGGGNLQVRVWTEHPELLDATRDEVEGELQALGSRVDLKILPLSPGPQGGIPSLRSLATGPVLHVLG